MSTFTSSATATGHASTTRAPIVQVSSTASASVSSTTSQEDATNKATTLAAQIATSTAQNDAQILDQSNYITFGSAGKFAEFNASYWTDLSEMPTSSICVISVDSITGDVYVNLNYTIDDYSDQNKTTIIGQTTHIATYAQRTKLDGQGNTIYYLSGTSQANVLLYSNNYYYSCYTSGTLYRNLVNPYVTLTSSSTILDIGPLHIVARTFYSIQLLTYDPAKNNGKPQPLVFNSETVSDYIFDEYSTFTNINSTFINALYPLIQFNLDFSRAISSTPI